MKVKLNSLKRCLPFLLSALVLSGCGTGTANSKASDSGGNIVKIACVGDSITKGIGADGWKNGDYSGSYPEQLGRLLGDGFTVGNFGKGSSYACYESGRTENLWYPNTFEYSQSMKFEPDIVIVMLGSNDARIMENEADSYNFKEQLTKLTEEYLDLKSKPEVYILSSITMGLYDQTKESKLKKYILPRQREIAEELGCVFIDTYTELYDVFISGGAFASDKVHPNNSGYAAIAELLAKRLKSYE